MAERAYLVLRMVYDPSELDFRPILPVLLSPECFYVSQDERGREWICPCYLDEDITYEEFEMNCLLYRTNCVYVGEM